MASHILKCRTWAFKCKCIQTVLYCGTCQIERLCKTVVVEDPMKTPNAKKLDSMTLQSYMDQHIWTSRKFSVLNHSVLSPAAIMSKKEPGSHLFPAVSGLH